MAKRKCSNCGAEIEYNKLYRPDLVFCTVKCREEFMSRDSNLRKNMGWEELK